MSQPDHRKDGTFRRRNKAALKGAAARVVLPAQRVAPETLASLQQLSPAHGGIGRVIDAAVQRLANIRSQTHPTENNKTL